VSNAPIAPEDDARGGYPRSWMRPFLDEYVRSGHLARSAQTFLVHPANIYHQVRHHAGFAAAFEAAQAEVAERIWNEAKPRIPGAN
jgi:hypothetical protein